MAGHDLRVSCKAGGLQRRGTLKSCIAQSFHHIIGTTLFYIRQEFLPAYFFEARDLLLYDYQLKNLQYVFRHSRRDGYVGGYETL